MGTRALPAAVEEDLLTRAGEINPATNRRWTTRELSAWLLSEHKHRLSHTAVAMILRRAREERQAAVADAIRAQVCDTLGQQLTDLDGLLAFYLQEAHATPPAPSKDDSEATKQAIKAFDPTRYARVFIQGLAMKLRFSGLGERIEIVDETPERPESPRDELARRIAELTARRRQGDGSGGTG
jgi:hypothetical protein